MKVVKSHEETPKYFFELYSNPKSIPLGPQKIKNNPKLSQNQMPELKVTKKMKIIALYEWTTKQFEPDPNHKN